MGEHQAALAAITGQAPDWQRTENEDGSLVAVSAAHGCMTVAPGGRLFKRTAVKGVGSGQPRTERVLVGELNGVRAYMTGDGRVVLTTEDLYP